MNIQDLIEKKKKYQEYTKEELKFIIDGMMNGSIQDYQISAILMAIYFVGMTLEETSYLTELMVNSGDVLDFSDISNNIADKHSTGGVGDKITLILLPILAAANVYTAKLSGKGLGHTGGTIDKLESIPGFKTNLTIDEFREIFAKHKTAIAAQTSKLTPADGKLYALRDVTSTVDIIPLIASSVISKKIASGANTIVLDVKCGDGAFVKDISTAKELTQIMINIGQKLGRKVSAIISNMDMPLGRAVGNSLEVIEVIEFLKGNTADDLAQLTYELAAITLMSTNKFDDKQKSLNYVKDLVYSGKALSKFREIIKNQNGNTNVIDNYDLFAQAKKVVELKAPVNGFVSNISALKTAKACKYLGAGRTKKDDNIDYAVGIYLNKKYAEEVKQNETIATLYVNDETNLELAKKLLLDAFEFSENKPSKINMIYDSFIN